MKTRLLRRLRKEARKKIYITSQKYIDEYNDFNIMYNVYNKTDNSKIGLNEDYKTAVRACMFRRRKYILSFLLSHSKRYKEIRISI